MSMYIIQYWSNGINQLTISHDGLPALANLFESKQIKFKVIGAKGGISQVNYLFDDVRNLKLPKYQYWLNTDDGWLKEIT